MIRNNKVLTAVLAAISLTSCNQDPVYVVEDPNILLEKDEQVQENLALKEKNEELSKENETFKGDKERKKTFYEQTYHKLLGTWSTEDDEKICLFRDEKAGVFRYVYNKKLTKEEAEDNAEAEATEGYQSFVNGTFTVQWYKLGMTVRKMDNIEIKGDRMMLKLRVANTAKKTDINFLTEFDYSSEQKGLYVNLPKSDEKFTAVPEDTNDYHTALFLNRDADNNNTGEFFAKADYPALNGDKENPKELDKLIPLVMKAGEAICEF